MLSDEEIWKFWWARPDVPDGEDDSMEAQFIAAARAIEREAIANFLNKSGQYLTNDASREAAICEATAPLIKQINEDEALMARALASLDDYKDGAEWGAYDLEILTALRQRLEAKK